MGRHSLDTTIAQQMNAARQKPSGGTNGGRPRKKEPRCPCDADTLARIWRRAPLTGKTGGHAPSCPHHKSIVGK